MRYGKVTSGQVAINPSSQRSRRSEKGERCRGVAGTGGGGLQPGRGLGCTTPCNLISGRRSRNRARNVALLNTCVPTATNHNLRGHDARQAPASINGSNARTNEPTPSRQDARKQAHSTVDICSRRPTALTPPAPSRQQQHPRAGWSLAEAHGTTRRNLRFPTSCRPKLWDLSPLLWRKKWREERAAHGILPNCFKHARLGNSS